jgi:PAS domain S-box-containing protein
MEETLRVTEKRLAFAVEYSQIGVWDLDLINNTSWRSIDHDRIFGYEVPPSKWSTVIAMRHVLPEDRQRFSQCIKKAFRTGKLLLECRIIQPNQSLRWIKARGRVIYDENAQPMRMLGTVVDITEHKNAKEKEREHLEKLAQVTRFGLMGEMASGIAHEVNQPLCAIATYAQVSINLINSENPDMAKIKEVLSKTQQQALRAGQIIHRMKEFGKSHLKQHLPTDINALIYNAADLCITELKENNVKLSFDLTNDLPLVCVDHIQIEQVIINLMRNSVDALQNVPTMHSRQLTIRSLLTPENDIQVSVKDNGLGIDEDQQQKILTPFHTTKLNGTGMGLSISHSLIQAHEGTLYFNSKLGKGSTFYFTLPIETAEREDLLQSI